MKYMLNSLTGKTIKFKPATFYLEIVSHNLLRHELTAVRLSRRTGLLAYEL